MQACDRIPVPPRSKDAVRLLVTLLALAGLGVFARAGMAGEISHEIATAALRRAASFFRNEVATHGGYVYYVSENLEHRYGEGMATPDQIWVQPPGTPAVGLSYLRAYQASGDPFYLDAARETAEALIYGQLRSGGWSAWIDFDPGGSPSPITAMVVERAETDSSLDDGQTQAATLLLARVDQALEFQDEKIHEATMVALDALLAAQFPMAASRKSGAGRSLISRSSKRNSPTTTGAPRDASKSIGISTRSTTTSSSL